MRILYVKPIQLNRLIKLLYSCGILLALLMGFSIYSGQLVITPQDAAPLDYLTPLPSELQNIILWPNYPSVDYWRTGHKKEKRDLTQHLFCLRLINHTLYKKVGSLLEGMDITLFSGILPGADTILFLNDHYKNSITKHVAKKMQFHIYSSLPYSYKKLKILLECGIDLGTKKDNTCYGQTNLSRLLMDNFEHLYFFKPLLLKYASTLTWSAQIANQLPILQQKYINNNHGIDECQKKNFLKSEKAYQQLLIKIEPLLKKNNCPDQPTS